MRKLLKGTKEEIKEIHSTKESIIKGLYYSIVEVKEFRVQEIFEEE